MAVLGHQAVEKRLPNANPRKKKEERTPMTNHLSFSQGQLLLMGAFKKKVRTYSPLKISNRKKIFPSVLCFY